MWYSSGREGEETNQYEQYSMLTFEYCRIMSEVRGMVVCSRRKVNSRPRNCGGPWRWGELFSSGGVSVVSLRMAWLARRWPIWSKHHRCTGSWNNFFTWNSLALSIFLLYWSTNLLAFSVAPFNLVWPRSLLLSLFFETGSLLFLTGL